MAEIEATTTRWSRPIRDDSRRAPDGLGISADRSRGMPTATCFTSAKSSSIISIISFSSWFASGCQRPTCPPRWSRLRMNAPARCP